MSITESRIALTLVFTVFGSAAYTAEAESNWKLRKERNNISVYTAGVEGSRYDAVLSKTVVKDIRLSSLVAVIMDAQACPEWADRCAESYVFEKISETEELVYTHNDLPFPVKDRDVLAHVNWEQNRQTLAVHMYSKATSGVMPKQNGKLRLVEAQTTWDFMPLEDGGIEIRNWAHIDPGSSLPSWVTNMLLVDTPYETVQALIEQARKSKYAEVEYGFIIEP